MKDQNKVKKHLRIGGQRVYILRHLVLLVLAAFWLIPIVWLLLSSFSASNSMSISRFFPEEYSLVQYQKLLLQTDAANQFPRWMLNTTIIALCNCVISSIFVLMVAYAMSRMRFAARKPMMNISMILGLFPAFLSMVATYFLLKTMGMRSWMGLVVVYAGSSGLGYLIAKGFFDTIPKSLSESAKIDGASEHTVFWKIIMPMSKPIIVYTIINSFLAPWMDFVYAKMILNAGISANYTVAVGLYRMLDKSLINTYFTQFCCGGVLVSIPISILFMIMQKFYVEGVTNGAVMG